MFPAESEVLTTIHFAEQRAREGARHRHSQIEQALRQEGIAKERTPGVIAQINEAWSALRCRLFRPSTAAVCA
jgi:hypothetical protein